MDDRAVAEFFCRKALEAKNLGRRAAREYLSGMGIPRELAEETLAGYDEEASARGFLKKKKRLMEGLPPETARRRMYSALSRRGFSAGAISRAFSRKEDEE